MTTEIIIYADDKTPFDPTRLLDRLQEVGRATLTTDHALSSHGQPVLVYNGQAYGPADIPSDWELAAATPEGEEPLRAFRSQAVPSAKDAQRAEWERTLGIAKSVLYGPQTDAE